MSEKNFPVAPSGKEFEKNMLIGEVKKTADSHSVLPNLEKEYDDELQKKEDDLNIVTDPLIEKKKNQDS